MAAISRQIFHNQYKSPHSRLNFSWENKVFENALNFFMRNVNSCWIWLDVSKNWPEWTKLILTTSVGGLLSYFYIIHRENKKEKRHKMESVTQALLNTQMSINLQMNALKSLAMECDSVINFNLFGKPLSSYVDNTTPISGKANKLLQVINKNTGNIPCEFLKFAYHWIIVLPTDVMIQLPQEIFSLPILRSTRKKMTVPVCTNYLHEIAVCNKNHMYMVSCVQTYNENRKILITQPISKEENGLNTSISTHEELIKILTLVSVRLDLALMLNERIDQYLKKLDSVFLKTAEYITHLNIATPIQIARDKNGNPLFDRLT